MFRHEQLPIQVNIVIGTMPNVPSFREQHQFANLRYGGRRFISESPIEVLGKEHYSVTFMLRDILPTKKYSIILIHPKRKRPIEFLFTASVYASIDEFEHLIENSDSLVKSFRWLVQE